MLSGEQSFLKNLPVISLIGTLSLTSTFVLAQEAPQTGPAQTNESLTAPTPASPTVSPSHAPSPEQIKTPIMETSYEFPLGRGDVLSAVTPDQSSDEEIAKLTPATAEEAKDINGFQHLVATVSLRTKAPQKVMFARSIETGTYDTLIVDRNLDGSFIGESPITINQEALEEDITQTQSRDGQHMIEFKTALMTDHVHPKNLPAFGDYPAILRLKWTDLNSTPSDVIWFGYYFYQNEISVADKTYQIILHDRNNDGQITELDLWTLKAKGNRAYIHRFDPKLSYEQDISKRDPWSADKNATRSDWKDRIKILTDHDDALKQATTEQQHLILKFESIWSETCSAINNFILPQQRVVDASSDYIWARFNDEENADLVSLYNVTSYPTFIILNPNGKEVNRFNSVDGPLLAKHLNESLLIKLPEELQPETLASHNTPGLIEESSEESDTPETTTQDPVTNDN